MQSASKNIEKFVNNQINRRCRLREWETGEVEKGSRGVI